MIEKPIQDTAIKILEAHDIEYLHIPNIVFKNPKLDPNTRKRLKEYPDLMFTYGKFKYMREFGIHGRHEARKNDQWLKMQKWKRQADSITDIRMIWSQAELEDDFRGIGLIV